MDSKQKKYLKLMFDTYLDYPELIETNKQFWKKFMEKYKYECLYYAIYGEIREIKFKEDQENEKSIQKEDIIKLKTALEQRYDVNEFIKQI